MTNDQALHKIADMVGVLPGEPVTDAVDRVWRLKKLVENMLKEARLAEFLFEGFDPEIRLRDRAREREEEQE